MKLTYADTKMINEIGKDIIKLSNEYNLIITEFFKKMTTFPYETNIWTGKKAEKYAEYISLDKKQYMDFADSIKSFGNKLINTAEDIEICIKATNNGDDYKE